MVRRSRQELEPIQEVRCAIYTRKSNTEGLDGDFSSLDAQREAAEAYIDSQKQKGWIAFRWHSHPPELPTPPPGHRRRSCRLRHHL